MAIKKWKPLSSTEVLNHPRMHLVEDEVQLPNGNTIQYLRQAPGAQHSVAVIAINAAGEILLQREYSYPPNEIMWQLPGGGMEGDEEITVAGLRELREESGVTAEQCKIIGYFYTDNRRSDRKQYVVVARDLSEHKIPGDPEEFIESHWLAIDEVKRKISAGEFTNINLLAALNLWFHTEENA